MRTFAPYLLAGLAFTGRAVAEPVDLETSARELARDLVGGKYDAAVARFDGNAAHDGKNPHWDNRNQRFAVDWVIEE